MVTNRSKLTQVYTFFILFFNNFDTFFLYIFILFVGKIQSGSIALVYIILHIGANCYRTLYLVELGRTRG